MAVLSAELFALVGGEMRNHTLEIHGHEVFHPSFRLSGRASN
jgi:hypothetical protein